MSEITVYLLVQPAIVEHLCRRLQPFSTALFHTDLSTDLWLSVKTLFKTHKDFQLLELTEFALT